MKITILLLTIILFKGSDKVDKPKIINNGSCMIYLEYNSKLKNDIKEYCLNLTDKNGNILSYTEHDLKLMSCVLNLENCK